MKLIKDDSQFIPGRNCNVTSLSLTQCLERKLLVSPDSKKELSKSEGESSVLTDGKNSYEIQNGCPVLYPKEICNTWCQGVLPLKYPDGPLLQYVLLSQIKQSGEINAPLNSVPARKHQYRFQEFCKGLNGLILDVGSDKPSHSMQLLAPSCEYLGLDPYSGHGEFRLIGLGELLPIKTSSVDAVLFNTSLDHILDYHTAIEEAFRVLKVEGQLVIATYAWTDRATLLTDQVHFHHFREYEILGALKMLFEIEEISRYEDPKNATHRYGLYIRARKKPEIKID
jgi:SAM-dependent methyltransferase